MLLNAKRIRMKRILTIQDISCVGKCSLTVALPIISAMGIEAAILPTAVLSTHTGFKNFTFCDLTDEIDKIKTAWRAENIGFDGIYTGFLGSFLQLEKMAEIFDEFGKNSPILVDPCMGDNGKLYSIFDLKFAAAMGELCKKADIITPNLTEACFLTSVKYPQNGYDSDFVGELLDKLKAFGNKKIVLKGISYDEKTCGVFGFDRDKNELTSYFHELVPQRFHGTGDMFASALFSKIVLGDNLENAIKTAANFVLDAIKCTLANEKRNWYGVDFESALPNLIKNL